MYGVLEMSFTLVILKVKLKNVQRLKGTGNIDNIHGFCLDKYFQISTWSVTRGGASGGGAGRYQGQGSKAPGHG